MPQAYSRGARIVPLIDFLIYSRGAGVEPDRHLTAKHWSFMDRYADGMTARGPTLTVDRETWTGSLHIVDLPHADAARAFVEHEPYNRAGLFESHVVRRFENLLGRTMWEFPDSDDPQFLVLMELPADDGGSAVPRVESMTLPSGRLIVHGELSTLDGAAPTGAVLVIQAPTREDVVATLRGASARLEGRADLEIHDWERGGRR